MEILIASDKNKNDYILKSKKPYLNFTYSPTLKEYIFYDKYRFLIGGENGEKALSSEVLKLRQSGDVVYLNVLVLPPSDELLLMLTKNLKLYLYNIKTKALEQIPLP